MNTFGTILEIFIDAKTVGVKRIQEVWNDSHFALGGGYHHLDMFSGGVPSTISRGYISEEGIQ